MRAENVVVSRINSKPTTTRYGVKPTYSFQAGGEWFNANFKNPKVAVGDTISFDYEDDSYGKAVDTTTIVKSSSAPVASVPPPVGTTVQHRTVASTGSKGVFPIPPLDGQRAIVRQNALTNARELVVGMIAASKIDSWADRQKQFDNLSQEVIRLARKFEAYSCGDLDMEEVKAEMAEKKAA